MNTALKSNAAIRAQVCSQGFAGGDGRTLAHGRKDAALLASLATKGFYVRHPCGILAASLRHCRSRAAAVPTLSSALKQPSFMSYLETKSSNA